MSLFLFVFPLLKHLSIVAAVYCGISHHDHYSILIITAIVLALQITELKDFTFTEMKPVRNQLLLKLKIVVAFIFPAVSLISFFYFTGLAIHTFS